MAKKIFGLGVVLVLFIGLPAWVYVISTNKVSIGYNQNYQPDQPIAFSHELHAGENQIACQYCHTTTEVSRHASVPSLNICLNCHYAIAGSNDKGQAEIQKIIAASSAEKPVVWNKVHLLPDFVKFNHAAHVRRGKTCQECHGPVQEMPVVYQWSDLSMGWCVSCHRKPENNADVNCGTCHY